MDPNSSLPLQPNQNREKKNYKETGGLLLLSGGDRRTLGSTFCSAPSTTKPRVCVLDLRKQLTTGSNMLALLLGAGKKVSNHIFLPLVYLITLRSVRNCLGDFPLLNEKPTLVYHWLCTLTMGEDVSGCLPTGGHMEKPSSPDSLTPCLP